MYFFYYIPLGINTKLERFPVMTAAYTVICIVVFAFARYLPGVAAFDFYNLVYVPQNANVLTAVGSAFLHLGWAHLIGNIIYLVILGRYVEDRMGPLLYTLLFLSSAAIGSYAQGVFNIHVLDNPTMGIIGASGAVSGLLGAFTVRFVRSKLRLAYWAFMPLQAFTRGGTVEIPALFAIALWFLLNVFRGLIQLEGAAAGVAYVNHVAGFTWGAAIAIAAGQYRHGRIESYLKKGEAYMQKGQSYAAQGEFIRYLSHRPDDAGVYASLARAMAVAGNIEGAMKNYRHACEMLLDQRQRGACEALFQEAERGYPGFTLGADHHLSLSFGLERNLKPELATVAYESFQARYPQHAEAAFALLRSAGLHRNSLANPRRADALYRRLIDDYPDDQWVDFAREQIRCMGFPLGAT